MNDQSKLMNPPPPSQMISQLPPHPQRMNPPPNPVQPRIMNHPIMNMNMPPQVMMNNNNNNQHLMMNPRNYNPNPSMSSEYQNQPNNFGSKTNRSNNNWKGKKITTDQRPPPPMMRMYNNTPQQPGGYKPPTLNELQSQNRLKTKKFYPKKKYGNGNGKNRYVPYAPRNTTSFIIRAKKSGGIAELVSPCPVTPAILPTPMFSPSREVLGDMAKEEWGVDGYGSMKGLIRLRSDGHDDDDDDDEDGDDESDVEEHVEVERRLDHDLSRFEMIYPSYGGGGFEYNNVLENRVDDQDSHIAQLEDENLTLKERLFLMERELGDLRRRLQYLERRSMVEEVVENESGSEEGDDDTGGSDSRTSGDGKGKHGDGDDSCMQDKEVNGDKRNVDEVKETQDKLEGKEEGEKEFRDVSGEECEGVNGVMVGMDQIKESDMAIEKLKDASENDDSVGEQKTTI